MHHQHLWWKAQNVNGALLRVIFRKNIILIYTVHEIKIIQDFDLSHRSKQEFFFVYLPVQPLNYNSMLLITHQNQYVALELDTKPNCEFHMNALVACLLMTRPHHLKHSAQLSGHSCTFKL